MKKTKNTDTVNITKAKDKFKPEEPTNLQHNSLDAQNVTILFVNIAKKSSFFHYIDYYLLTYFNSEKNQTA